MTLFSDYLNAIKKEWSTGIAREHACRPALKNLLEGYELGITAVNEPARIKCGAPDFVLLRGSNPIGYVEAKDINASLNSVEKSKQLQRYRDSLHHLILTNYLEFRWYVDGEKKATVTLATLHKGKIRRDSNGVKTLEPLLSHFFSEGGVRVGTAKELARRMAHLARMMRDAILATYADEDERGAFHAQIKAFQ